MATPDELQLLIKLYLKVNPEPSDAQFHTLAEAIGVDKEELEAIAYKLLGECTGTLIDADNDDSQDVLEDAEADPATLPLNDVANNDGDPTREDTGLQEELNDDGATEQDIGIGFAGGGADILNDDGALDMSGV